MLGEIGKEARSSFIKNGEAVAAGFVAPGAHPNQDFPVPVGPTMAK